MLSISTDTLPTGAAANYQFQTLDIIPLSFIDIIDYLRTNPKRFDEYESFMYRYRISKNKIKGINNLYLPDIYYVWYILWSISINEDLNINLTYECTECDSKNRCEIGPTDVKYKRYDKIKFEYEFSNQSKLRFTLPTGDRIERYLPKYSSSVYSQKIPFNVALMIISCDEYEKYPVEVEKMILGATHEDAVIMFDIMEKIVDPIQNYEHQCRNCGYINNIDLNNILFLDFFRLFLHNTRPVKVQDNIE